MNTTNNCKNNNKNALELFKTLNFVLFSFSEIHTEIKGNEEKKKMKLPKWRDINETTINSQFTKNIII